MPIIYYEGKQSWTAVTNFKDRIFLSDVFSKYIPNFSYELISLHNYSNEHLLQNKDEISLIMLLNKLQDLEDFKNLPDISEIGERVWEDTPEYLLEIIARITTALLTRLNLPQEDVDKAVNQVKERNMPVLFENFKGFDFQAARKEGKIETQVFLICRKLQKGHNISQIAEALEMKKSEIRPIYKIAQKYAPDYDPEAVFTEVLAFLKETGKI